MAVASFVFVLSSLGCLATSVLKSPTILQAMLGLRFPGILLFKSLLRYSRHDTMISRISSLSIIQIYSLGISM